MEVDLCGYPPSKNWRFTNEIADSCRNGCDNKEKRQLVALVTIPPWKLLAKQPFSNRNKPKSGARTLRPKL